MSELESNLEVLSTPPKGKPPIGMPETVRIILEENDGIPPTGQYFGVNGKGYMLKPGEVANVPRGLTDVLDNAVMSVAVRDPNTQQVTGYRDRMRFPYRVVSGE